jgi:hypothetical protein
VKRRRKSVSRTGDAARSAQTPAQLTGWKHIAEFLGQPAAAAQRWAKEGMPVRRAGRHVTANPQELSAWLARESGAPAPVHIAESSDTDLLGDLRRALAQTRRKSSKRAA